MQLSEQQINLEQSNEIAKVTDLPELGGDEQFLTLDNTIIE